MSAIYDLFLTLERAGPGTAGDVIWALAQAGTGPGARVLDAGCGVGADTGTLLGAGLRVTALDASPRFVAEVARRHPAARAVTGDMLDPPVGPWDLIWSAGAVYHVGIAAALDAWRGVLAPGGRVAFSDLRARVLPLPEPCAAFWATEGLSLTGPGAMEDEALAAGWRVLASRWVPHEGWAAYYEPLEPALDACPDPGLVAGFRAEIANWRAHGDSFGYQLLVCEPEK